MRTSYRHTRLLLEDFKPTSHWIVIREDLARNGEGIIIPDMKNSVFGFVLAVGPDAEAEGLKVGDKVVYEQWMGGRWAFTIPQIVNESRKIYEEVECLIMSVDSVWCIVRD